MEAITIWDRRVHSSPLPRNLRYEILICINAPQLPITADILISTEITARPSWARRGQHRARTGDGKPSRIDLIERADRAIATTKILS
jgi:hypothetical protein